MKPTNEIRTLAEMLRGLRRCPSFYDRVQMLRVVSILVLGRDVVKENP